MGVDLMYFDRNSSCRLNPVNYEAGAYGNMSRAGVLSRLQLFLDLRRDNEEERRREFNVLFRRLSMLAGSEDNKIARHARNLGIGTRYTREFYNISRKQLSRNADVPNQFIILLEHLILPAELSTPGIERIAESFKTTRQYLERQGKNIATAIRDRGENESIEKFLARVKRHMAQNREMSRRSCCDLTSS